MFTKAQLLVIEAIIKLCGKLNKTEVGMFEGEYTLHQALTYLWKRDGITENCNDVIKELVKYQYVVELPGSKYRWNGLCTCGRRSRYIPRVKNVYNNIESVRLNIMREMLDMPADTVVIVHPVIDDRKWKRDVKKRKSKQVKPKTQNKVERIVRETTVRLRQLDALKGMANDIRQEIQELRGIKKKAQAKKAKKVKC